MLGDLCLPLYDNGSRADDQSDIGRLDVAFDRGIVVAGKFVSLRLVVCPPRIVSDVSRCGRQETYA